LFSGDYDPEPKYIITPMAAFTNRSQLQVLNLGGKIFLFLNLTVGMREVVGKRGRKKKDIYLGSDKK